jgi:hypothetical protein
MKAIPWNSKNINKVDPFSPFALLNKKQSTRFVPFPSEVFPAHTPIPFAPVAVMLAMKSFPFTENLSSNNTPPL